MKIRYRRPSALITFLAACSTAIGAFCFGVPNDVGMFQAVAGSREVNTTRVWDLMPPDERAFITAVQEGAAAYRAGQADARAARAKKLCAIPQVSQPLQGWIGRMAAFAKNAEGKGVLSISISQDLNIETGDGSSPDTPASVLIAADDPLLTKLPVFRQGQLIRFFGAFVKSDADCVSEANSVLEATMTKPGFLFRFSDVIGL